MGVFKKIGKYIKNPSKIIVYLNAHGFKRLFSDKFFLKCAYKAKMDKKLNLENPQTFNEKLQWLKLYDRKPEYTQMVDKYVAKEYVANKIGEEYIVKTFGVWDKFDDIDFSALPNEFVLKTTHDSSGVLICTDKRTFDIKKAKEKLEKSLKRKYYYVWREWPYKNVKPRIIAEKYLEEEGEEECLTDYKFFCFNGVPKIAYISKDNSSNPHTDFFDMDFNHLNMRMKDPNSNILPEKPKTFEKMKELAEILSKGIPHLRVDFYSINDKIYSGELTFFHNGGFGQIKPEEWDYKLGGWIDLPKKVGQ